MTRADIERLEHLISAVKAARSKRDRKETHEASLLEFMCAESRLTTWLQEHTEELIEAVKLQELLRTQAACKHVGWKVCQDCHWSP